MLNKIFMIKSRPKNIIKITRILNDVAEYKVIRSPSDRFIGTIQRDKIRDIKKYCKEITKYRTKLYA